MPTLAWLLVAVGVTAITCLCLSQEQREIILQRLQVSRRPQAPTTTTKAATSSDKTALSETIPSFGEYATTFPPSQRHMLAEIVPTLPAPQQDRLGDLVFNESEFRENLLGFDEDYRDCDESKFLPSGFRVREVKALGDFPDYSLLTGVPHPQPYNGFSIDTALPRPYRPLRFTYHQTMSLTKLEPDWWIELENTYKSRLAQRQDLYRQHGDRVLAYLPGSELACKEVMEMVLQYVVHRYPHYFSLNTENGITTFYNNILHTTSNLSTVHPLHILLEHIPEDFAVMLRHPSTGLYHFRAGIICSSLGWNLGSKFGLQLNQIHQPVPHYASRMEFSMDRFFSKLRCDKPIQRGSWGFEVDQPLYMAPGDPIEKLYREQQHPELTPERCHLRVDWQTLRRLPVSGAVLFNFKALFTPLPELRDEPYVPALCLKVLREGDEGILKYKNAWHTAHVVMPALETYASEQVEKKLVESEWEARTLDETPFFPGWEERWHVKQGF